MCADSVSRSVVRAMRAMLRARDVLQLGERFPVARLPGLTMHGHRPRPRSDGHALGVRACYGTFSSAVSAFQSPPGLMVESKATSRNVSSMSYLPVCSDAYWPPPRFTIVP